MKKFVLFKVNRYQYKSYERHNGYGNFKEGRCYHKENEIINLLMYFIYLLNKSKCLGIMLITTIKIKILTIADTIVFIAF